MKKISILMIGIFLICSCREPEATIPKPRMFPRVEFPVKAYQAFDESYCAFNFDYPKYAEVIRDTAFFGEKPVHPCWFDILIPSLNGRLHCSYYPIRSNAELEKLIDDAFVFASKHNRQADYRDELKIQKPNDVSGVLFDVSGEVATPVHFFLTDSTQHYFRASLYFNNQVNPDSMEIVHEFVKDDIAQMIETFEWKNLN